RKIATASAETCSAAGTSGTPSRPLTGRSAFPPLPAELPPGGTPLPAPPGQGESGRGVGEQADAPADQRPLEPELPRRSAQVNGDEQDVDGDVDRRVDDEPDLAPCHRLRAGGCALFQHRLCSFSRPCCFESRYPAAPERKRLYRPQRPRQPLRERWLPLCDQPAGRRQGAGPLRCHTRRHSGSFDTRNRFRNSFLGAPPRRPPLSRPCLPVCAYTRLPSRIRRRAYTGVTLDP